MLVGSFVGYAMAMTVAIASGIAVPVRLRHVIEQPPPIATRYYWPATVAQLAMGTFPHTHAALTGIVLRTRLEDDGDRHIWLRDLMTSDSVLAECIPALPCPAFAAGARVTLRGITRRDPEHRWNVLHPVELFSLP